MDILKYLNLGIRFILEIISLVAIGYWGFQLQAGTLVRYSVGIGVPIIIMIIWGTFGSPAAPYRLSPAYRIILQIVIFASAILAVYFSYNQTLSIIFAILIIINTLLFYIWKQQP